MAIGVANALAEHDINIPEDIAVVGYDCSIEGRKKAIPLTSADIPAANCGINCARWIRTKLEGVEVDAEEPETKLFIGQSCGCKPEQPKMSGRDIWKSDEANAGLGAAYDHFVEDMLSQTDYRGFYNTIFQHVYQIRNFDSFSLCMNDYWNEPAVMNGEGALKYGYTRNIHRIIKCGPHEDRGNFIDFDDIFDVSEMIPELYEDREKPSAYFFTPIYFNDRCFGYAVISYSGEFHSYTTGYRSWVKSVMQGMESFYRQAGLTYLLNKIEATQVRDALTGLYNYKGFLAQGQEFCENATFEGKSIEITAIDLNRLKDINAAYGRKAGDAAILKLSQMITEAAQGDYCARMCNDEFIVASAVDSIDDGHVENMLGRLNTLIDSYNANSKDSYQIEICTGMKCDMVSSTEALDHLVNDAIILKNNRKALEQSKNKHGSELSEQDKKNDILVTDILDNNRFIYHFQPIVNARTGEVYAYEALMRADTETYISPLDIIQSAERLDRLYDIEKATFFNVVRILDEHAEEFKDKKVFINSIPGSQLKGEDRQLMAEMLDKHSDDLVVEFTEETEIGDDELHELKDNYERMNIDTAIDDYGAGYSNVNNLLRYMPRYVKIDRMLMSDIHEDPQKQHFVRDIIEFAHDNDILILAEGVELNDELREVIKLGADLIQGYYTSRPQPYIVRNIDERVVNEIVQYNQGAIAKNFKKYYEVAGDTHLSLVQLALNKYTGLKLKKPSSDDDMIVLKGAPGFQSNLLVVIEDGFDGKVVLDTVSFAGERGIPCIDVGHNCHVTIVLDGDNELRTGGIRVPKDSSVTFEGEGNLSIILNSGKYFGIGNDIASYHGDLTFNQDGGITINANGMKGVGIGSGLGGNIYINRGKYEIELKGQYGVSIGSIDGAVDMYIQYCDMDINSGVSNGTVIGSINNNAKIRMENISGKFTGAGNVITGIGTVDGGECDIKLKNVNIGVNIRALECYGIGCRTGNTDIVIRYASVKSVVQGKSAYAMGNSTKTATLLCANSDTQTNVVNNLGVDIGAAERDIHIENGRTEFIVNGELIEREIVRAEL
jgi:diguanylate cyclase (GGDEF)-like protein